MENSDNLSQYLEQNQSGHVQFDLGDIESTDKVSKMDQISPTGSSHFSFSRASSIGSVTGFSYSSASSAQNTDDEDSDSTMKAVNFKERRREAHTQAEQKRRDAIKKGYDDLQLLVPTCQQTEQLGATKLSKAAVLQRSIDYMQYLIQQKKKQEDDLENLRKEVTALKIMKANYEHIVKAHKSSPEHGQNQVSDEVKFHVFQHLMDALFQSFNGSISVSNFAELSGSVFRWLEEYCKPQLLRDETVKILTEYVQNQQQYQQFQQQKQPYQQPNQQSQPYQQQNQQYQQQNQQSQQYQQQTQQHSQQSQQQQAQQQQAQQHQAQQQQAQQQQAQQHQAQQQQAQQQQAQQHQFYDYSNH